MNKLAKYIILPVFLIPLITGCGFAYKVLLGVDSTPNWKLENEIVKQAKKYNIPNEYNLVLDTADYYNGLKSIYNNLFKELNVSEKDSSEYFKLKKVLKDDTQPVQFRLFDNNGIEIFKIVNCYVDPPIPMNWNVDGCFDAFPPKTKIESLNSHFFDLDFLLSNSSSIDQSKLTLNDLPQSDYYGIIMWNDFFKRPSKKLIKTVKNKIQESDETIVLIYVNNQNAYLWQVMDSKTKEEVKTLYNSK